MLNQGCPEHTGFGTQDDAQALGGQPIDDRRQTSAARHQRHQVWADSGQRVPRGAAEQRLHGPAGRLLIGMESRR